MGFQQKPIFGYRVGKNGYLHELAKTFLVHAEVLGQIKMYVNSI